MSRIAKCDLPAQSLLHGYIRPGDFVDCYRCISNLDVDTAAARAMAFPVWANWLLRLRNIAVIPFGLSAALPEKAGDETIGHFPLVERNDNEVILGFDDKHLDFRISILTDGSRAFGATWVRRHNRLGYAYLAAVMPFHVLIMRNAVGQVAVASQAD